MHVNLRTLDIRLDAGASSETTHATKTIKFGDGYAQRVSHGINTKLTHWSGTKKGDLETMIKPIMAFLDEHAGLKPFLWFDPLGRTNKYVCPSYSVSQVKGNFWQITLKFEQVF